MFHDLSLSSVLRRAGGSLHASREALVREPGFSSWHFCELLVVNLEQSLFSEEAVFTWSPLNFLLRTIGFPNSLWLRLALAFVSETLVGYFESVWLHICWRSFRSKNEEIIFKGCWCIIGRKGMWWMSNKNWSFNESKKPSKHNVFGSVKSQIWSATENLLRL